MSFSKGYCDIFILWQSKIMDLDNSSIHHFPQFIIDEKAFLKPQCVHTCYFVGPSDRRKDKKIH